MYLQPLMLANSKRLIGCLWANRMAPELNVQLFYARLYGPFVDRTDQLLGDTVRNQFSAPRCDWFVWQASKIDFSGVGGSLAHSAYIFTLVGLMEQGDYRFMVMTGRRRCFADQTRPSSRAQISA